MEGSWNCKEHVQSLRGSGWANPMLRPTLGRTFRAYAPCSNPLWWCSYTNNTDTQAFCSPRVQSATPPSWHRIFRSPRLSALTFNVTSAWASLLWRKEAGCTTVALWMKNKGGVGAESSRQKARKRRMMKSFLGMCFAPDGQIVLRLLELCRLSGRSQTIH